MKICVGGVGSGGFLMAPSTTCLFPHQHFVLYIRSSLALRPTRTIRRCVPNVYAEQDRVSRNESRAILPGSLLDRAGVHGKCRKRYVVGPLGFEPRTKGFTLPQGFPWAWTISSPSAAKPVGCGTLDLSLRALKPSGSLCTFRRCTAGLAQGCHRRNRKVSLNSSRPLRGFRREGTLLMSPLH
jgi:hypothetical protein